MDRETIEKAAKEYASRHSDGFKPETWLEEEIFNAFHQASIKPFVDGAQWRINSVWHDTSEIPEPGKDCLVEYKDGDGNVCARLDWRSEYEWVNACHYDKILRWAYIDDLLPDGKEETK